MTRSIILCVLAVAAGIAATSDAGYQETKWGMTPAQVVALYPDAKWYYPKAKYGASMFNDELLGMKMEKRFHFTDDKKLHRVAVTPLVQMGANKKYVGAWPKLHAAMHKKYGKPSVCKPEKCFEPGMFVPTISTVPYQEGWVVNGTVIILQAMMKPASMIDPYAGFVWDSILVYSSADHGVSPEVIEDISGGI